VSPAAAASMGGEETHGDPANAGIRREPEIPPHEAVAPETDRPAREFEVLEDEPDEDGLRAQALQARMRGLARQAALDPDDGIVL
jgi:type IV secretion system protein VirD4